MNDTITTQEEVTTIEKESPQVVKKTVKQVVPPVQGEHPQKVYEAKKAIVRVDQVIWYVLSLIEILLMFRIVLKMVGANPFSGFTSLIYGITAPLALPFYGILGFTVTGNTVVEWSTMIAGIVYLCIAWGLAHLLDLVYPITPKDIEPQQ